MAEKFTPSRRAFLRGSAAIAAGSVAGAAAANGPDPLITELQDWASYTGAGVDETPYGMPISFERHVVRRNVILESRDHPRSTSAYSDKAELPQSISRDRLDVVEDRLNHPQLCVLLERLQ